MIFITLFNIYYSLYLDIRASSITTVWEVIFYGVQIYLVHYYQNQMINLEMERVIIVTNHIYFIDQVGIYKRRESIKCVNNVPIISSKYQGFFGALFNYGAIEIVIKGDTPALAITYHMCYMDQPIETVNQINIIIEPKHLVIVPSKSSEIILGDKRRAVMN